MDGATPRCERCDAEVAGEALFCPMCGAPRTRRDGDPLLGEVIAERYLLRERLGHGAWGTIYLAEHVTLRRAVAVKILHQEHARDEQAVERFRREATMVGQLENEHIVQVSDFGRAVDGRLFLAMEHLEGETLQTRIARAPRLDPDAIIDVLAQLADGLAEAHALGVVHRDLRPRNVFLARRRGKDGFVKLLDFGLAKLVERSGEAASTSLGMTFGDPRYMSPEAARGEPLDRRADIYSLGVIGYELLTGTPPFVGERVVEILDQLAGSPPRPILELAPDTPPWLAALVHRLLEKRPGDRIATCSQLAEILRNPAMPLPAPEPDAVEEVAPSPSPSPSSAPEAVAVIAPSSDPVPVITEDVASTERVPAAETMRDAAPPPPDATPPSDGKPAEPSSAETLRGVPAAAGSGLAEPAAPGAQTVTATVRAPLPVDATPDAAVPVGFPAVSSSPSATGVLRQESEHTGEWYARGLALEDEDDEEGHTRELELEAERDASRRVKFAVGGVALLAVLLIVALAWPRSAGAPGADAGDVPAHEVAAVAPPPAPDAPVLAAAPEPDATPVAVTEPDAAPVAPAEPTVPPKASKASRAAARREAAAEAARRRAEQGAAAASRTPGPEAAQAEFYVKLGQASLRRRRYTEAVGHFDRARSFDPGSADALAGLGEVALRRGAARDAVVHLGAAMRIEPRSVRILTLLGQAHLAAGQQRDAEVAFRKALAIAPEHAAALAGLAAVKR